MNKSDLLGYLERIDGALTHPATLCVYGSAAFILLDEPGRTSLDMDVAAPYSLTDFPDLTRAAKAAGIPVNPPEDFPNDHIEWIASLRLCLPRPDPETEMLLWQGSRLTVKTVSPADLIASKLIRYDDIDQSDIRYLLTQGAVRLTDIATAVARLPPPFQEDPLILDNLRNLEADIAMWGMGRS